jgi:hypothetical protein
MLDAHYSAERVRVPVHLLSRLRARAPFFRYFQAKATADRRTQVLQSLRYVQFTCRGGRFFN